MSRHRLRSPMCTPRGPRSRRLEGLPTIAIDRKAHGRVRPAVPFAQRPGDPRLGANPRPQEPLRLRGVPLHDHPRPASKRRPRFRIKASLEEKEVLLKKSITGQKQLQSFQPLQLPASYIKDCRSLRDLRGESRRVQSMLSSTSSFINQYDLRRLTSEYLRSLQYMFSLLTGPSPRVETPSSMSIRLARSRYGHPRGPSSPTSSSPTPSRYPVRLRPHRRRDRGPTHESETATSFS